jgi:hypothetical protein
MGLYVEMQLCYGITVDLRKSTNELIKKFVEIVKKYGCDCRYEHFLELDDSHIEDKEYDIDYEYYEELIRKLLHISKSISIIFGEDNEYYEELIRKLLHISKSISIIFGEDNDISETFIGVKLECLCDTKAGFNVKIIKPMSLRNIMLQKNKAQTRYGKRLTEIAKLLFPEQNIKPDIVFLSDVE